MQGARLICLIVLLELIVGCGSQQPPASTPASGVTGTVTAGPISPVAGRGKPTTRPVHGAAVEALRGSKIVAVAHTDEAGHYQLTLPHGTYLILVKSSTYLSSISSKRVTLTPGEALKVSFVLDTGMR